MQFQNIITDLTIMAASNIQDLIKDYCKLYKGGDTNPYKPEFNGDLEAYHKEYLRFHVWDAEKSAVQNYYYWLSELGDKMDISKLSKEDRAEEVYNLVVRTKLQKMETDTCNYIEMYFKL